MTKPVPKHSAQIKSSNQSEKFDKFCTMRELTASERKLFTEEIKEAKSRGLHPILIEKYLFYVPYLSVAPKRKYSDEVVDQMIDWWEAQRAPRLTSKEKTK